MVETPAYDLTIFKVHYGKMTLKIYTKGERVLRIEVIVHNTKEYRWGRSLPCFPEIVTRLQAHSGKIPERGWLHGCVLCQRRHAGKPAAAHTDGPDEGGRDRSQQTSHAPRSRSGSGTVQRRLPDFTASDLARQVHAMSGQPESEYGVAPRRL